MQCTLVGECQKLFAEGLQLAKYVSQLFMKVTLSAIVWKQSTNSTPIKKRRSD